MTSTITVKFYTIGGGVITKTVSKGSSLRSALQEAGLDVNSTVCKIKGTEVSNSETLNSDVIVSYRLTTQTKTNDPEGAALDASEERVLALLLKKKGLANASEGSTIIVTVKKVDVTSEEETEIPAMSLEEFADNEGFDIDNILVNGDDCENDYYLQSGDVLTVITA